MKDYLIETPADVLQVIKEIKTYKCVIRGDLLKQLKTIVDDARDNILAKSSINWANWFLKAGFIVYNILIEYKFDELHFAKFLVNKHRLYGIKPLLAWEELGILVRLYAKITRILNITNNLSGVNLSSETIEDNLKDFLGYCILGYLLTGREMDEEDI